MSYCVECGTKLLPDANFCSICGTSINRNISNDHSDLSSEDKSLLMSHLNGTIKESEKLLIKNLIQTNLRTEYLGKNIEYYQIIDSTNKEAHELINNKWQDDLHKRNTPSGNLDEINEGNNNQWGSNSNTFFINP